MLRWAGARLGRWLSHRTHDHGTACPTPIDLLRRTLQPADVLLVEGDTRVSVAIKYLTQSTWSHAALYVGPAGGDERCFVEADIVDGVRRTGFETYEGLHTRICRPVGLKPEEIRRVVECALARVGHTYDLKNVFDLVRYLVPTPPVPVRWRRRMLTLGSGDPTRAICSTLVAQCFQTIRYPILPGIAHGTGTAPDQRGFPDDPYRVRHHSLFVPRDFDVSPWFLVVKPTIEQGFDFHRLRWTE
ncbi:MAG: lipo-like protein [Gammaproteobacteria bacterium]